MYDALNDREEAKPIIHLVRILGQLGVAGMTKRYISHLQLIMEGEHIKHYKRRFCFELAQNHTLSKEYVVMVPWKDRDTAFDHFYIP